LRKASSSVVGVWPVHLIESARVAVRGTIMLLRISGMIGPWWGTYS